MSPIVLILKCSTLPCPARFTSLQTPLLRTASDSRSDVSIIIKEDLLLKRKKGSKMERPGHLSGRSRSRNPITRHPGYRIGEDAFLKMPTSWFMWNSSRKFHKFRMNMSISVSALPNHPF